jgi:hypothetical protein
VGLYQKNDAAAGPTVGGALDTPGACTALRSSSTAASNIEQRCTIAKGIGSPST